MNLSIIIPTYNGKHKIKNLLDSIKSQTIQDFELIVSIDGSVDGTYEYLSERVNEFSSFVIINENNGGRSICRNRAALIAKGELLLFLDDDMRIIPTFIEMLLNKHTHYKNSIILGAAIEELNWCTNEIQKYKAYLSRKWTKGKDGKLNYPYLTAANFSLQKSLFLQLGLFDERFTDAEDYDLAITAFEQKIDIYLFSDLIGWHDDLVTCKSYIKRTREYANAHKKLAELNPDRYLKKYPLRQPNKATGLRKIIYSFFSNAVFVKLIDNNYLKYLPHFIKYRIYDYVITGLGVHFKDRK